MEKRGVDGGRKKDGVIGGEFWEGGGGWYVWKKNRTKKYHPPPGDRPKKGFSLQKNTVLTVHWMGRKGVGCPKKKQWENPRSPSQTPPLRKKKKTHPNNPIPPTNPSSFPPKGGITNVRCWVRKGGVVGSFFEGSVGKGGGPVWKRGNLGAGREGGSGDGGWGGKLGGWGLTPNNQK